jgi:hypothetical protein
MRIINCGCPVDTGGQSHIPECIYAAKAVPMTADPAALAARLRAWAECCERGPSTNYLIFTEDLPAALREAAAALDALAAPEREGAPSEAEYVIWSGEHAAYWRQGRNGYTADLASAGRWSLVEAHRLSDHCGPEKMIEYRPAPAPSWPTSAAVPPVYIPLGPTTTGTNALPAPSAPREGALRDALQHIADGNWNVPGGNLSVHRYAILALRTAPSPAPSDVDVARELAKECGALTDGMGRYLPVEWAWVILKHVNAARERTARAGLGGRLMGYAIYQRVFDGVERDCGYGVPCLCDHPGCTEEIDRGLAFLCGCDPGEDTEGGCGRYFCDKHRTGYRATPDPHQVCSRCAHSRPPWPMKPDVPEWVEWKLTDESWAEWRAKNPDWVVAHTVAGAPRGA